MAGTIGLSDASVPATFFCYRLDFATQHAMLDDDQSLPPSYFKSKEFQPEATLYVGSNGDFINEVDDSVYDTVEALFAAKFNLPDGSVSMFQEIIDSNYYTDTNKTVPKMLLTPDACTAFNNVKSGFDLAGLSCSDWTTAGDSEFGRGHGMEITGPKSLTTCKDVATQLNELFGMEPATTCPVDDPSWGRKVPLLCEDPSGLPIGAAVGIVAAVALVLAVASPAVVAPAAAGCSVPWSYINQAIPKGPCIKAVLQKLGLLWCFEIDYPTEKDPENRKVEIATSCYRKSVETCGWNATLWDCFTIDGPTVTSPGDTIEPSTALFDPNTALWRCLGCPDQNNCFGKWCVVHGPNPDASNANILCDPGAACCQNCCGSDDAGAGDAPASDSKKGGTTAFGFSDSNPAGTPGYLDVNSTN